MIVGIGTDICSIERFADEEKRNALMARFYTEGERAYVERRGKGAAASAAAIFAAYFPNNSTSMPKINF